jgi:hypothetical protein
MQKKDNLTPSSEEDGRLEITEANIEEIIERDPQLAEIMQQKLSITQIHKHHSGPIPDPETLKLYKSIYKNAPQDIFNMAKKEQSFRHFSTYFGQISALLIGMGGLAATAYLGVNDQPWLAGVIGFGSLGSLVGVFLQRKKK